MSAIGPAVKLHLNKREDTFLLPLYITATVALISIVISLLYWRSGSLPGTQEWIQGSRANPGIAYGLASFLVYFGVQSVASTFPFALTLGATRRSIVAGQLLSAMLASAYLSVVFAVLLLLELATGHWFVGFYIFDVNVLGAGELTRLLPTVFLATLALLSVGGAFGASWVRYGAKGPVLIGTAVALTLIIALAVAVPWAEAILAAFELWWLAIAAIAVIATSATGTWLLLRSASVR